MSTTSFTDVVQHDSLFVESDSEQGSSAAAAIPLSRGKKDPWQHMVDTRTRYTHAYLVKDLTTNSILQGLQEVRIRPFGPPRIIESDQEGGLISEEAK
eukprot:12924823-Prorocentrum_lima.AAC.1